MCEMHDMLLQQSEPYSLVSGHNSILHYICPAACINYPFAPGLIDELSNRLQMLTVTDGHRQNDERTDSGYAAATARQTSHCYDEQPARCRSAITDA